MSDMWSDPGFYEDAVDAIWFDSGPAEELMPYICHRCYKPNPCGVAEHERTWSDAVWMGAHVQQSIACFLLDHTECTTPMLCNCGCHVRSELDEPSPSDPPTNR